jgi:RNA polymerase sigma-54 factor
MLPNRKVIPFSDFFTPSLSIKDVIKELIEREGASGQALSDMRIRDMLMDRGYRIARRTVAKYRAELRILPSTVR